MRALVVEDDATTAVYLVHVLETQGFEVQSADSGPAGFDLFQGFRPDLVMLDIVLPGMDGIELLERIRKTGRQTIVVVTTAVDRPEVAAYALELGASNYLTKPVHHVDLVAVLRKYATVLRAKGARDDIGGTIVSEHFTIRLDNRLQLVPKIADYLVDAAAPVLAQDALLGVRLGLVELLVNAIEHGNLGITFEEKTAAMDAGEDALETLRRDRLADPGRAGRRVMVEYTMNGEGCEWVIRDEGDGFDWHRFFDRAEGDNWLAASGRGILLSRFQFDDMAYEGAGNIVRVRKEREQEGEG